MYKVRCSALLAAALLVLARAGADQVVPKVQGPVPLVVDITAKDVVFSREKSEAVARGDVHVKVQRRDDPSQWLSISAAEVTANLATGVADASQGVRVQTSRGVFSGRDAHLDFRNHTYWMKQTSIMVDLKPPGKGPVPHGYFQGQEIGAKDNVYYVIHGRITTCDKRKPDWYIQARKMVYDTRTGMLKIWGGRIHLYGISIPMISPVSVRVGPSPQTHRHLAGAPGYSSRDSLFLRGGFQFSGAERATALSTSYRLSLRRGWVGRIGADHASDVNQWSLFYSRRETHYYKLSHYFDLDRAPEARFTHYFIPERANEPQQRTLALDVSAGYLREFPDDSYLPHNAAGRLHLDLRSTYNPQGRDNLIGDWYGWEGDWNEYSTGDHYGLLGVYAGRGWRLSDRISAGLTAAHYVPTGHSPLLLDIPQLRSELRPEVDWRITNKWRVLGDVRYDLSEGDIADYYIEVQRRVHCLTWYTRYRGASKSFNVGFYLTGITGGTRPYRSSGEPVAAMAGGQAGAEGTTKAAPVSGSAKKGASTADGAATSAQAGPSADQTGSAVKPAPAAQGDGSSGHGSN